MNRIKLLLILLWIFIHSGILHSDERYNFHFNQISTKDGLSQNTVRAVLEDKQGFIWAGTLDGLNRYDGYGIKVYKPELNNPYSLVDHRIKEVFQGKNGYLWIKTYKNEFNCYNPATDSFFNSKDLGLENGDIPYYSEYYESSAGDIWLWGNNRGCARIQESGNTFSTKFYLKDKLLRNRKVCRFLFEDSRGIIWTGGDLGLFKINDDGVENIYNGNHIITRAIELNNKIYFTTIESCIIEYDIKRDLFQEIKMEIGKKERLSNIARLSNNELLLISQSSGIFTFNTNSKLFSVPAWSNDLGLKGNIDLIIDKNDGIWIFNHSGYMWYYNQETQKIKKLRLIPDDIVKIIDLERYNVFIGSTGLIWITTYGNGVFCYDYKKDILLNFKYNANQNSPASDYLLSITEDRYGNIWIGSEYAGIVKVVKSNFDIRIIRPEQETSIGKNNNVRTLYEDTYDNIWLGTKNGSLYMYDNGLSANKMIYKDINPYSIAQDSKNRIWIGTKGKGLYLLDGKSHKEIAHYEPDSDSLGLSHNTIFSILKDSKSRMWIGSFGGGLNLVEETTDRIKFRHFFFDQGNRSYIRCVYQDTKGVMWVGSSDGIIRFSPDELIANPKAYKVNRLNLENSNGLNCNDIKAIYEDEDGTIWIGTAGGGLNKYIPPTKTRDEVFVAYTSENGLSGDFVSGILEDKEHNLWISTESGITKYDKATHSFMVYQFSEKTYGNHFNENANIYSSNGYMLWGSLDGLLIFNPESFIAETNTPPVTLTNMEVDNQSLKAGEQGSSGHYAINYNKNIKLSYKENTFTIEFATLDLKDSRKNKYTYILEGFDKRWSNISTLNTATYKNLPPGKYIFKVRGSNSSGIWNPNNTELEIYIIPPIWKTWYAYTVYFLLFLTLLYIAFRIVYKFNVLNNNIKVEKELTNYKLRFFTNISHEFRTPLTLIRGAVENINAQVGIPEQVKKQVNILSRNSVILTRLIDQLLEFRKLQNNVLVLNLEEVDMVAFARDIYNNFKEIAEQKNIEYLFVGGVDTHVHKIYIDRTKVDKILYNLLSNAFKFTPKDGRIEFIISFDAKKQTCLISVKDNGIGVAKEKQHLLFSRFMQINFSSTGTGVGLSLVKEFVDVHRGKIWYEDNAPNGSIFNVELSTNKETYNGENFVTNSEDIILEKNNRILYPSENVENIQLPEIKDSTLANYNILIIDDNDDIRNFLIDEFSKYMMIDSAENGAIGFKKAVETNPDIIICDVMMPEMDGFEVTRRLKDDFQTCHIPIIMLTAHSSIEHQLEGIQSGADAYIMKPFSLKYLVARVFKLIEQREQLKKRFSNEYILDGNLITSTDKDKDFFALIDNILDEHIADSQFSVDKFAELAKQRRTVFYKKVKGITGLSPNELIKIKRLKRAAELLLQGELTVSEVSYKVGFEDPFYFSKCFKAQYNCSPSKYGQVKK